jgi:hypothetical protein
MSGETGYGRIVAVKNESAPKGKSLSPRRAADRTPVSSSGVVARAPRARPRDSEPPDLTPYQARLDVEMDDTAISKVRDPSVSISLDAAGMLPLSPPPAPVPRFRPIYSIALGTLLGALIVALMVLVAQALSQ